MNKSCQRPDFVTADIPLSPYQPDHMTRDNMDAVLIATPPHSHAEIAITALQQGMPVFIEKPLTLDHKEAADILAQHRTTPAPFLIDHIYLFHAGYRTLKQVLSDLGPIRAISTIGGNRGPFRPDTSTLWDWAPHDVSICLDLVGQNPDSLTCRRHEQGKNGQGDNFEFSLTFPDQCEAQIFIGNLFERRRRQITVYTETDTLRFEDESEPFVGRYPKADPFTELEGTGEKVKFWGNLPLTQALMDFRETIRANDSNSTNLSFGLSVIELIENLDRAVSSYNGSN